MTNYSGKTSILTLHLQLSEHNRTRTMLEDCSVMFVKVYACIYLNFRVIDFFMTPLWKVHILTKKKWSVTGDEIPPKIKCWNVKRYKMKVSIWVFTQLCLFLWILAFGDMIRSVTFHRIFFGGVKYFANSNTCVKPILQDLIFSRGKLLFWVPLKNVFLMKKSWILQKRIEQVVP